MIDDPVMPAAAHLTGPHAGDVLATAVRASGGDLLTCRPVHVQYRPGSDLIVRYAATVRRPDGTEADDTLLAGATRHGAHPGTVPVEAVTDDGIVLEAGVWRWPFDPVLEGLDRLMTPALAEAELGDVVRGPLAITVVVYRPAERVVARIVDADDRELYVKIVAPGAVAPLAARHARLAEVGLPVPSVVATGPAWVAMTALPGTTLREAVKSGAALPPAGELMALCDAIRTAGLHDMRPVRPRLLDAAAHARMLASVLPGEAARLAGLARRFDAEAEAAASRCGAIVHGDLHEGQLIVDDGHVVGLLDVDDAGPGDPFDDMATLLGHLRYRALTASGAGAAVDRYASGLRRSFVEQVDPVALDTATAATLIGLATGPFRVQQPGWEAAVGTVLDAAQRHLAGDAADA